MWCKCLLVSILLFVPYQVQSQDAFVSNSVQEVPSVSRIKKLTCFPKEAHIEFNPSIENSSSIQDYFIQCNVKSFGQNKEIINSTDPVEVNSDLIVLPMIPWSNYTFQLITRDEIGNSDSSDLIGVCITPPNVPFKNPDDVEIISDNIHLKIHWKLMEEIEHNGPGFRYIINWKRDLPLDKWSRKVIYNENKYELKIPNQSSFARYRVKVEAVNDLGKADKEAKEIIGYSEAGEPTEGPKNLTLTILNEFGSVLLQWNSVSEENLNGFFDHYSIEYWNQLNEKVFTNQTMDNKTEIKIDGLYPNVSYFARVFVHNKRFKSPSSEVINFTLTNGLPSNVQKLQAFPLGSTALLLKWSPPKYHNNITNYKIAYKIDDLSSKEEIRIIDPNVNQTKITNLEPNQKYKINIAAVLDSISGPLEYIEIETNSNEEIQPDSPAFKWEFLPLENEEMANIKITWLPSILGHSGLNFFVKYRLKGNTNWSQTKLVLNDDFIIMDGILKNTTYEFVTVSVDGPFTAESSIQEITIGEAIKESTSMEFHFSSWKMIIFYL